MPLPPEVIKKIMQEKLEQEKKLKEEYMRKKNAQIYFTGASDLVNNYLHNAKLLMAKHLPFEDYGNTEYLLKIVGMLHEARKK